MNELLDKAIQAVRASDASLCKFITANDTGATGGHQAGYHLPRDAWSVFFAAPGRKGANNARFATVRWQDDFETVSRFIYYGVGTRNEYRLTRFGRDFPFLRDEHIGDLLIIARSGTNGFHAWILNSDDDIEEFFAALGIDSTRVPCLVAPDATVDTADLLLPCFREYLKSLEVDFPPGIEIARRARLCFNQAWEISDSRIRQRPDDILLNWIDTEYRLFRMIEAERYAETIKRPFDNIEAFIETANTLLNRRKSRAGKSLEYHVAEIFSVNGLRFTPNARTEGNRRPDFVFPGEDEYHDPDFDVRDLFVLGCKTTCKDRWRQVLNEATRVPTKHLLTLQQGISANQLREMKDSNLVLVVPRANLSSFPKEFRPELLTIEAFVRRMPSHPA